MTNRIAGRTASINDHAVVCEAILARDPARAKIAMQALIDDVLVLIERMGEVEG